MQDNASGNLTFSIIFFTFYFLNIILLHILIKIRYLTGRMEVFYSPVS